MLTRSAPGSLPQSHLLHLMVQMRAHHPSFTLFLGAGASVLSGVVSAQHLIRVWREKHAELYGAEHEGAARVRGQPEEYSFLFESLFDHASLRRNFIEDCIKDAAPTWGYIYLANLIQARVFDTIFTTNFDDLINEACFAYSSSVRPVVCAHDSSITTVRIFSKRPKIVKLHGDFLFDSIKNTEAETQKLEKNMAEKFRQYASEFGMIVIGYSGNDRSVMDAMRELLEQENTFPNGVYWCLRRGTRPSATLERFARFPKFRIVEIEGFDEFCAELHNAMGLPLQEEVADPYGALTKRLDGLMRKMNLGKAGESHPIIERDVSKIAEQLVRLAISDKVLSTDQPISIAADSHVANTGLVKIPFVFLGDFFLRRGENRRALICAAAALNQSPSQNGFDLAFRALRASWDDNFASETVRLVERSTAVMQDAVLTCTGFALEMMNAERFDAAARLLAISDRSIGNDDLFLPIISKINHAQLYLHRGENVPPELLDPIRVVADDDKMLPLMRWGACIVLQRWDEAETHLHTLVRTDPLQCVTVATWPIFKLQCPHIAHDELRQSLSEIRLDYLGFKKQESHAAAAKLVQLASALNLEGGGAKPLA